jgi:hypothetical protein
MMNWCGMSELTGRWKLNEWNYGEQLGRGLEFITPHSTEAVSLRSRTGWSRWTTISLSWEKPPANVTDGV